MKKIFLLCIGLLLSINQSVYAYYFVENGIRYMIVKKGCVSVTYSYYSGDIMIPSQVIYDGQTYNVTEIGSSAFTNCSGLTSVTIPNSVTSIGNYAFSGCSGMTSITIPNSITSIGVAAFQDCGSLTSAIIPNSVTFIGTHVFYNCSSLKSVTISNRVKEIGYMAFDSCKALESVIIGNSVISIGEFAFTNCSSLSSVVIPNSVTSIGDAAFSDCSSLSSVTIPNSVTYIGPSAFYDTPWYKNQPDGLVYIGKVAYEYKGKMPDNTSITIKDGTLGITGYAFSSKDHLVSVVIPNSVTSIGASVFSGCSNLKSIKVESGNKKYDSRDNCNAIIETSSNTLIAGCNNTIIPNNVTAIDNGAFSLCYGLTSITIPNGVTSIGSEAFIHCRNLSSITIPNSVTSIDSEAFYGTAWYDNQPDGLVYAGKVAYKYKGDMPENTTIIIKEGTVGIAEDAFSWCRGLTSVAIPNSVTRISTGSFQYCI